MSSKFGYESASTYPDIKRARPPTLRYPHDVQRCSGKECTRLDGEVSQREVVERQAVRYGGVEDGEVAAPAETEEDGGSDRHRLAG